jgi:lipooligosaccharide transport system permease protein
MALTARATSDRGRDRPLMRYLEREAVVHRRFFRGYAFSKFGEPVLYLLAIGVGLGSMIDAAGTQIDGLTYLQFVAPGLMAATVVQSATGDSLWPVLGGFKWVGWYHAMAATPMSATDIFFGTLVTHALKFLLSSLSFLIVATLLGAVLSPWGLLAVPAAACCGLAIAAPISAFSATQDNDHRFALVLRFLTLPMFLFSGTFFPLSQLPAGLQVVAWIFPLWHGVELCREATTGTLGPWGWPGVAAHLAVLGLYVAAGWLWGVRTFTRRLAR